MIAGATTIHDLLSGKYAWLSRTDLGKLLTAEATIDGADDGTSWDASMVPPMCSIDCADGVQYYRTAGAWAASWDDLPDEFFDAFSRLSNKQRRALVSEYGYFREQLGDGRMATMLKNAIRLDDPRMFRVAIPWEWRDAYQALPAQPMLKSALDAIWLTMSRDAAFDDEDDRPGPIARACMRRGAVRCLSWLAALLRWSDPGTDWTDNRRGGADAFFLGVNSMNPEMVRFLHKHGVGWPEGRPWFRRKTYYSPDHKKMEAVLAELGLKCELCQNSRAYLYADYVYLDNDERRRFAAGGTV